MIVKVKTNKGYDNINKEHLLAWIWDGYVVGIVSGTTFQEKIVQEVRQNIEKEGYILTWNENEKLWRVTKKKDSTP
ncbi:MAG: hypothetical protein NT078_00345 [Candidatus Azambacteria bacterium]|nr:hypothetical protein [Candidatus Azambacteria bacterium]